MLEMAPEDGVKLWDLLDMELEQTLIKGKAVLVGDAARPFLPRECLDLPMPQESLFSVADVLDQTWAKAQPRQSRTAAR